MARGPSTSADSGPARLRRSAPSSSTRSVPGTGNPRIVMVRMFGASRATAVGGSPSSSATRAATSASTSAASIEATAAMASESPSRRMFGMWTRSPPVVGRDTLERAGQDGGGALAQVDVLEDEVDPIRVQVADRGAGRGDRHPVGVQPRTSVERRRPARRVTLGLVRLEPAGHERARSPRPPARGAGRTRRGPR